MPSKTKATELEIKREALTNIIRELRDYANEHGIGEDLRTVYPDVGWGCALGQMRLEEDEWHKGMQLLSVDSKWDTRVPGHFHLSCKDRFIWLEHREELARIVQKHGWGVVESWVWWNDQQPDRLYQRRMPRFFFMDGGQKRPWERRPICRSKDPRSFISVFEQLRDAGVPTLDGSYMWTETGFVLSTYTKNAADMLLKLFSDCQLSVERKKSEHGLGPYRDITVVFPDMVERADA